MSTNEIISYYLSFNPNMEQIHRMLDKAFEKLPRIDGLIFFQIKVGNISMLIIEILY